MNKRMDVDDADFIIHTSSEPYYRNRIHDEDEIDVDGLGLSSHS